MKKTWEKPQLIVLVRSNQPEAVLSYCKSYSAQESGPGAVYPQCLAGQTCYDCSGYQES